VGAESSTEALFREVYDATFDDVRRFCLRRLRAEDVNDAVAEVYVVAWKRPDMLRSGEEVLPWLYGVARNVVRHTHRGNMRRFRLHAKALREPTAVVAGPEVQVVRSFGDEALAAALRRLSESDQEVVRLRAWENLTAPAIAAVLGCSVSAAEKRVSRAFKRLEKHVGALSPAHVRRSTAIEGGGT
jgi:RNA polymerase sigma factor (sigma-70 family)